MSGPPSTQTVWIPRQNQGRSNLADGPADYEPDVAFDIPLPALGQSEIAMDYSAILQQIIDDPRYQKNLDWGTARPGHPEGTLRAHIAELEHNLARLTPRLSSDDVLKLRLLIHSHDSFKPDADPAAAIQHPDSHASLARKFLAEFCADPDLLAMVQNHDESFALWRQAQTKGSCNQQRWATLLQAIGDWDLFLAFLIIDGCTKGKSRAPLKWFFEELKGKIASRFSESDILPLEGSLS